MAKCPLRLVVVDGHVLVRAWLAARLRRLPDVRVLAAVGELDAAWRLVRELEIDAVLLEPRTVGAPPVAAVRWLVRSGYPTVVLTSSLAQGEAETFLHAGAAAALLKGVDLSGLLSSIRAVHATRWSA